jgi:hypothetical protein
MQLGGSAVFCYCLSSNCFFGIEVIICIQKCKTPKCAVKGFWQWDACMHVTTTQIKLWCLPIYPRSPSHPCCNTVSSPHSRGSHCSDFHHQRLALPIPKLHSHKVGNIWLLSFTIMFENPSMLCVSAVLSFHC